MSGGGTQQSLRKALGALKDTTTVSLAKVNSEYKDLDIAIVKATNHVERPAKEKHIRIIFAATSASRPRADVAYCIHALARRLAKTHNWAVALKTLIVIHRALREVDPTFREELINYSRSRGHILNLSYFKDDSSPNAWDYSAWVRSYALFLEERLECYRVLKYDIETERLRTRELDTVELLEQLPALQQYLFRLMGCQPEGAAISNHVIQYALTAVSKESIKLYTAINDATINLVDKFFEMQRHDAIKALEIYRQAGKQVLQLTAAKGGPDGEGIAVDDAEYIDAYQQFLLHHYLEELEAILLAKDDLLQYPLQIDFAELLEASPPLAKLLYIQPAKFLPHFDHATLLAQGVVLEAHKHSGNMAVKESVHVRLNVSGSAMECPETHPSIGRVRVKHTGKLITLKGTVIRSGGIKMLEGEREYQCTKCKHRFIVFPELEAGNIVRQPTSCPSQRANACQGSNFKYIEDSKVCHDYQEIKIQENMQALDVGSVPRSMPVILKDDLVDFVKAGDDIIVTGILFAKWRPLSKDVRCDLDLVLLANHIRRTNELKSAIDISEEVTKQFEQFWVRFKDNPLKGRNIILQGICPQIYGLFTVKLAVALTLIGGLQQKDVSGTKIRGESHLLLVGDPGTGKSQFLKFAAKLSHRSVITTGLGSTSAGLTVTAVKDGGEWMLEAGALVLADGGLCCIDEFDSIREPDRATIHEAMEQQTISVAKAGLVTTLNTRTTVFGVTNPKGQYDPYQPLSVNTTLSGPLLSRFDIVLVLLDTKKPEWDKIVSSHILSEHAQKEKTNGNDDFRFWTLYMLRRYIHFVKEHFRPVLTKDAEKVIASYYQLQRRSATQNAARTTIRMLESLIRLAQAHARLMFRNEVTRLDAISAIICVESSMTTSAILDNVGNVLHSSFSDSPDKEYAKQEKLILQNLDLMGNTSNNQNGGDGIADNVHVSNHERVNTNQPTNEGHEWDGILSLRQCSMGKGTRGTGRTSQQPRADP